MKKIMILGAGIYQVPLIETAKTGQTVIVPSFYQTGGGLLRLILYQTRSPLCKIPGICPDAA